MPIVECLREQAGGLLAYGPRLRVQIGFDPSHYPSVPREEVPIAPVEGLALIDTGAGESFIDDELARRLGFPIVDRREYRGIHGSEMLRVYMAFVTIPGLVTQSGRFAGAILSPPHQALIGRVLLKDTLLIYDGQAGVVKLAR